MKIVYLGPCDAVDAAGFHFPRGVEVDVPAELAGRPPSPRLALAMVELGAACAAEDDAKATELRAELDGLDRGAGLLAQSSFAPAAKKSTPAAEAATKEDDR